VESTRKGLVLWSLAALAFVALVLLAFPATQAGVDAPAAQPVSPTNAK
jgi:hypothetical protein